MYAGVLGSRPVAVKIILDSHGPDLHKKTWTAHYEALMMVELQHENLVSTYDWCRIEESSRWQVWIVQELCRGGPLGVALKKGMFREGGIAERPPDAAVILETALDIARGMEFLHSQDEMHADLSSNNVLLQFCSDVKRRTGWIAKISDFGLGRMGDADAMTQSVGTVSHMAPELLVEGTMSPAADVFSFGVILWELWAGKRAWDGMSSVQVIFAVTCEARMLEVPEGMPPEYASLMSDCMSMDKDKRPSFAEIVPRLEKYLDYLCSLDYSML